MFAAGGLVQQHTGPDAAGFERPQFGNDTAQGFASVQDVVHQQHVAPAHVQAEFLGEYQFAGFRAAP